MNLNYTCHAATLNELIRHIDCCEIHYGIVIDRRNIIKPMPPAFSYFKVDSGIPRGTKSKCPKDNKGCEPQPITKTNIANRNKK